MQSEEKKYHEPYTNPSGQLDTNSNNNLLCKESCELLKARVIVYLLVSCLCVQLRNVSKEHKKHPPETSKLIILVKTNYF